jgi:PAS domain S-box-containing protein
MDKSRTKQQLLLEIGELRTRLGEAEETLRAIRSGEVDALVVSGPQGDQIYTLQGADRFYRVLMETMAEGAATLGRDGTILYCNRRLATMLGMPLEKVIGSSIEDHVSSEDWQTLQRLFRDGKSSTNRGEFKFRTAAGDWMPVLFSSVPLEIRNQQGMCFTAADLTWQKQSEEELRKAHDELEIRVQERTEELVRVNKELQFENEDRKRAEEALRESEERYRLATMATNDSIWDLNLTAGTVHWNETYKVAFGRPAETGNSWQWWIDHIHPEDRERTARGLREAIDGRENNWVCEYRFLRADGIWANILDRAFISRDESGKAWRIVGSMLDLTERLRAEHELFKLNQRLQALMQAVPVGVSFSDDPTCQRITGNPALLAQFEMSSRDNLSASAPDGTALGRSVRYFQNGREVSDIELPLQRAVTENRIVPPMELEVILPSGRRWFTEASSAPVRDAQGSVIGGLAVTVDITERKRMEEELRRSRDELEIRVQERTAELARVVQELQEEMAKREKVEQQLRQAQKLEAIGTLTGGIAHDFNNILGPIVINSEIALLDLPKGSAVRNQLDLILKSALRGKDLVKQMLLFSRKSEKKQEILILTPLIKETFKLLRSSLPATIQMELHLKTESDAVYADPSQVQQVIMNLCTNAAYAMRGTTGSIDISLEGATFGLDDLPETDMQPGDYLVLSVKDTGSGMGEEVRKQLFEPFFTTKPVGEGTGLGLSVVYGIVKTHKGGITVSSEPGKGSIFRVYLPKADTGVSEKAEPPRPIPRGNERILFVDDEEIITHSVRNMLLHLGYKVTALTDSEEALKLFSANPSEFDLVMVDQTMPSMTGEDLGKELMRMRPDVPIILCTGYSDLISSEKAMALGFRGFILKPFAVREGAELVRRVLDEKKSSDKE